MNNNLSRLTVILLCVIICICLYGCSKINDDGYVSYSSIDKNLTSSNFKIYIKLYDNVEYTNELAGFPIKNDFGIKFLEGYLYSVDIYDSDSIYIKTIELDFRVSTPESLTDKINNTDIRIIIIVIFAIQFIAFTIVYFWKKYRKAKLNKK